MITPIFKMSNTTTMVPRSITYKIKNKDKVEGICTSIAMEWAKKVLKGKTISKESDLGNLLSIAAVMTLRRNHDNNPKLQYGMGGLKLVKHIHIGETRDIIKQTKNKEPHVAIFYNNFHTMGFASINSTFEFFDNNYGLYRTDNRHQMLEVLKDHRKRYKENFKFLDLVDLAIK